MRFIENSIFRSLFWNELMELAFGFLNMRFIYTDHQKKTRSYLVQCLTNPFSSIPDYKASAWLLPEMENFPPRWEPILFSVRSNG